MELILKTTTNSKLNFSRDVEYLVDRADVDETNSTASINNIAKTLEMTQLAPETDAYFFSKIAQKAETLTNFHSGTAKGSYEAGNVLTKIKGFIAKVKKISQITYCLCCFLGYGFA